MDYTKSPYFHVGRATELTGKDYLLYRFLEIFPGSLSWGTIALVVFMSATAPIIAAFIIIAFDLYWFLKTVFLSMHLRQNWKRLQHNTELDWNARLSHLKHDNLIHLIILPFYNESKETVFAGLEALTKVSYNQKKFAVVLASEERAGEHAKNILKEAEEKYRNAFGYFLTTTHPKDIPGEMAGKGSNASYAIEQARVHILDAHNISYEDVIVSNFDIDTVVYKGYFACLTWHFLTAENPYRSAFQPVPVYNNNMWESPPLSRVVALTGTFWQMIQQERPERLTTFSSHSHSFKALYEAKYWQPNMVSEDSRIFWNMLMAFDGDYISIPMSYPISLDANTAPTLWQTIKNIYKQQRRWTYGVENVPYILFSFIKNKNISLRKKIYFASIQIEGFWSLATNPLIIFLLGFLPLFLGGRDFNETILAYNLPTITQNLMILAMSGLVFSAYISMSFLPPTPPHFRFYHKIIIWLQWLLVPITIVIFGAIPGLDAQTRLMFGRYMGFWVTPKYKLK